MGFGEGSSPALHGDTLVVIWDHEGDIFIVALDKNTGKELWRTPRNEETTWATPLVVDHDGKPQVVIAPRGRSAATTSKSGKPLWECGGMTANAIPSPVAGGRPRLRYERLPRLQPAGDQARATTATSLAPTRSPGAIAAARPTCRRRCCTTTGCTSSPATSRASCFDVKTGQADLTNASASRACRASTLAGRRRGPRLPGRPQRDDVWSSRMRTSSKCWRPTPGRAHRRLARAGGERTVPARTRVLYCIAEN